MLRAMANATMEYRFLGRTGVRVSALGFGTMSFGGDGSRRTPELLGHR
jgi:aryl-alcohol dehydrogenase-like predicted oxidoreductase